MILLINVVKTYSIYISTLNKSFYFLSEIFIWFSFLWSLFRTFYTLIEDKSIHRNRAERFKSQYLLQKEASNLRNEKNGCQTRYSWIKEKILFLLLQMRYLGIPLIKAMPTVLFRMLCFWLLLSYSTEFYPDEIGTGPGLGLCFPLAMMLSVIFVNLGVGHFLGLKIEEALTNAITNLVIPVYLDVYFQVKSLHSLSQFICSLHIL